MSDKKDNEVIAVNKTGKAMLLGAGLLCAAGALNLYLIAPDRSREEQRRPFLHRNFGHRGLYDAAAGIPENSLAAFRAAAENGYGVELDTRLTRDGKVVIAHDGDLFRMTGEHVIVEESTLEELRKLRLQGTEETVPLFSEALDVLCKGGVPVIVEVKTTPRKRRDALCSAVLAELDKRDGDFCVESFDPWIVRWFRFHAPDLLRGQLTSQPNDLSQPPVVAWLHSRLMFNFLCRPQFIAHHVGKKSLNARLAHWMGAMRVTWTAHDRAEEKRSEAVIFEHFRPPVQYR
ncbi:MAG: glycerophosphodiester phosphodiesterase [Oscillospiraceae bacterium]|nr:glycerophosphodiester phosphodiesterase [Oscillospiraceae bacterium]